MSDFGDEGSPGPFRQDETIGSGAPGAEQFFISEQTRIVTARGTEEGLILRIDGRAEWEEILGDLASLLGGRRKFFEGGEVSIEWLDRLPTREQSKELEELLQEQYGIAVTPRRRKGPQLIASKGTKLHKRDKKNAVTIPLFNDSDDLAGELGRDLDGAPPELIELWSEATGHGSGKESQLKPEAVHVSGSSGDVTVPGKKYLSRVSRLLGDEVLYEDDANAKIVFGTLRSGQRIETPFSLVVIGDVNPGADLVAGGDIIVIGNLRGTAHASAYDDEALDHVIIALQMQPMQLRIGSVISRGSDEVVNGAEIARIENRRIIVEAFNTRILHGKRYR